MNLMRLVLLSLIGISTLVISENATAIEGGAEWYISPSFGGTEFSQSSPAVDHKRSWDFLYNMGIGLGIKGTLSVGLFTIGAGAEFDWKEEAVEHRSSSGVAEYDYQMGRLMGGAFFTLGRLVHFYGGYDPYVNSTFTYTDNLHVNPFRTGDVLKGKAYTAGIGMNPPTPAGGFLLRFLGRKIVYDEAEMSGTDRKLPDSVYSEMKTVEFVIQAGASY